ncbi:MAG: [Clostridia bacterium]|nr:[FeFe] hydrogenase H-cluster radical SAM maturase HydE [Clostridia bacterium]
MNNELRVIINKLIKNHSLTVDEYEKLISLRCEEAAEILKAEAVNLRKKIYGNKVFIRGLIEVGNICKNDCYYCGIRKSNKSCERYRLTGDEILACCENGYQLGFRTFVLQGGEDAYFSDDFLSDIIKSVKKRYPDCAVTLSLGERSRESYERLFNAGADRYLLRHETADEEHYRKLHPEILSLKNRIACLENLKEIGYQVGCGFMVGSPCQTAKNIAKDLKFIEEFKPDMCGIGPFIPHKDTPFRDEKSGTVELTCYLLSVIRIIHPNILLPSTTALGTVEDGGREKGILASANVVMPNLSPVMVRSKYLLYNNKLNTGAESAEKLQQLKKIISDIGYEVVCDRGDVIK